MIDILLIVLLFLFKEAYRTIIFNIYRDVKRFVANKIRTFIYERKQYGFQR